MESITAERPVNKAHKVEERILLAQESSKHSPSGSAKLRVDPEANEIIIR